MYDYTLHDLHLSGILKKSFTLMIESALKLGMCMSVLNAVFHIILNELPDGPAAVSEVETSSAF